MQTEARVGVVVEGGQRALNSAHGGVAVNGTARKLAQQQKSLHQQSQIGTVPQLLAGGIDGALSKTCTAPLARLTILLQRYYLAAGKELMRINGTTKSFVASYLAESIAGAMTIRAFGEEDRHFSKNLGFIDMHASPFFYSFTANEWLILRLEILCAIVLSSSALALTLLNTSASKSDPYRFLTWKITYGDIYPLGVKQRGILINGQFPGPQIDSVTNDNLIISVYNYLTEPFLISWSGLQQRRNSWQDGTAGTNCPIPPGKNMTYALQVKDQIGSFFYFPSLAFHKAAGGFGGIRILSRPRIPVPFPAPSGDFTVLAGDWFKRDHAELGGILDRGHNLPFPDGLLINGRGWNGYMFQVDQGKTYRFRISNVGLTTSINFRIQGHKMKLVEVEGSHTLQNTYSAIDIHLGQSYSVLVTADQPPQDYYIVVSSRFTSPVLTTTAVLHYSWSTVGLSGPPPGGPTTQIDWSLNQARSIRWNLSASGPRPNPQGSYHYGLIKTSRTIMLANSAPIINGKQRYAVNSVSYMPASTPLKLADYFNIPGVFYLGSIPSFPTWGNGYLQTSVMPADFRSYIEIVFQNWEETVQSWHIDGYSFFVMGMDGGQWAPASRASYNLRDTVARCTVQVYPKAWTAIYMALDNVGMWNVRSENWARQYLGQQFYLRVFSPANSWRDEIPIPKNALLCGRAAGRHTWPL